MKPAIQQNAPVINNPLSYAGYRFPPDVVSYAVWLYHHFPVSLHIVEELLPARGIEVTYAPKSDSPRIQQSRWRKPLFSLRRDGSQKD